MKGEVSRILEILEGAKDENGCVPMALVRQAFKKLERQWIPCSKRLPKVNTEVLVQFEKNMAVGFYHLGWWHVNTGNGFYTSILTSEDQPIAWMPLPEPYREE